MGCWNKTCGLTRLHIREGDPVYVFALQKTTSHERCYSTAFWQPCLLPWTAVYNEYGSGEQDAGVGLKLVIDGIAKNLVELEEGENQFHDIAVKREGFDLKRFYEAVHEGRLFVKDFMNQDAEVDFVMMRRECVDDILNTWSVEGCHYDRKTQQMDYYTYTYDDVIDEIPVVLAAIKDKIKNTDEYMLVMHDLDRLAEDSNTRLIKQFLQMDRPSVNRFVRVHGVVKQLIIDENLEQAELILRDYVKGQMLNSLFEITRRNWAPGGHEGSQCDELDAQELILDITKEAIDRERKEREDY